ncbi:MAG TPA: endopeptidase La [Chthoniobacterales bacterium]|jgi:ATP-dependent Lon protease|nr:endopeptidase La [Chthoniobacterales bacterium]
MSSEPQERQDPHDPVWSKAPVSNASSGSVPETTSSTDAEQGAKTDQGEANETLAILPVRGIVLFPGMVVPLTIGRPSAIKLVDSELPENKQLGLVTQRDEQLDRPEPPDLFRIGVSAQVLKLIRQPDGVIVLIVQVQKRIALESFVQTEPYLRAIVQAVKTMFPERDDAELQASFNNLRRGALRLLELSPEIPDQARAALIGVEDPEQLTDLLAGNLGIDLATKQRILEETDLLRRMRTAQEALQRQLEIAELQQKLRKDVEGQFSDTQRRVYLREQLRAIQRELGEDEADGEEQADQLRKKLQDAGANESVLAAAEKELKRLSHIPSASPEYSVIISYVEMLADLPWNKSTDDNTDLERAQAILDRDHYGLEKVKRRIVEFLAVRKLNPSGRSPILCFLGPPGVGKTSLGQSIADALGRKFTRISLGGIRDEAEIRGHRRTYIGAMPGRIIQEIRRLGVRNPVMMLDEVDKVGSDIRGDPASALLEVLDPRQNNSFVDRYLDVPFDLSHVIFIGTANYMEGIPSPLRDRLETISVPGYTEAEKLNIAQRYLVPRQIEEHGLRPEQCRFEEDSIKAIIQDYTYEAGVRDLERKIAAVCRSIAAEIARGVQADVTVSANLVRGILGNSARSEHEQRLPRSLVGVVTGLAYTPTGGDILFVEATKYPGKGGFLLTGQVGDVMRESMQAAYSLVRARAKDLGINSELFAQNDVHIHVPSGAIQKDGPSAGVAIATALASLFSDCPVRNDLAMTGEITLRGVVLPIGGLKEKSLAALRAGIAEILIPKGNVKDLDDIPLEAKERIRFRPVQTIDEVLAVALIRNTAQSS